MFNRYWRYYPWGLQLILFILMVFTLASFFTVVIYVVVPAVTGVPLPAAISIGEGSSRAVIRAALLSQALNHMSLFLIPSLLFVYLTHPDVKNYLGLRKPGKSLHWPVVLLLMISFMPCILAFEGWISSFDLGEYANRLKEAKERMLKGFMKMNGMGDLIQALTVMALLPAVGEELFFRGILMRFAHRRSGSIVFAILLSSLIFALFHFSVYSFLSIFLAGALLGTIYYLTGSMWCNILCHLIHNGLQIVLIYYSGRNAALKEFVEGNSVPGGIVVTALVLVIISFLYLLKIKTPLAPSWSSDFTPEEIAAEREQTKE